VSTLKVDTITKADGTGSLSVPAESGTVVTTASPSLGRRNLIINGAMQVAQRGTQVTGETSGGFTTVDRTKIGMSSLGTWTVDQSTDAPSGFSNSKKVTCTTADASPAASDLMSILQEIEAQNLQHLAFGTADAKALTLSFWVKSNKTGTATVEVLQNDGSRMISPTYSISVADTWEYKTVSVPADTSGSIDNDTGPGMAIRWWLNSGSNWSGGTNRTSWTSITNADRNASNLGVGGAVNDYFAITGVQLEVGSVATPFEHRSYGEELALCQRYFHRISRPETTSAWFTVGLVYSSTVVWGLVTHPTTMRSTPSVSYNGTTQYVILDASGAHNTTSVTISGNGVYSTMIEWISSGLTAGYAAMLAIDADGYHISFDAEL